MEATPIHLVSFCKELSASDSVWTIHKDGHVPAVADADGYDVMPFWSSRDRAVNFLNAVDGFEGFAPLHIPWPLFKTKWVPDLIEKKIVAGVNWIGGKVECQADPEELVTEVESHRYPELHHKDPAYGSPQNSAYRSPRFTASPNIDVLHISIGIQQKEARPEASTSSCNRNFSGIVRSIDL